MTNSNDAHSASTPDWADAVLTFWFEDLTPQDWFAGGTELDARIREKFGALFETLSAEVPEGALTNPRTGLAAIILFDQMSRNLFRGTARAFSADDLALTIARHLVDNEHDALLPREQRSFVYLPFEHSEVLADGERCVSLFRSLGDENGLAYAIEHRDILARFGRYPHRNKVLERQNTPEEEAFLKEHQGFGQ